MATARVLRQMYLIYSSFQLLYCVCIAQTLFGLVPMDTNSYVSVGGRLFIYPKKDLQIRLLGTDLTNGTEIFFTTHNSSCSGERSSQFYVTDTTPNSAVLKIYFIPPYEYQEGLHFHICIKDKNLVLAHQGVDEWLTIGIDPHEETSRFFLPLWLQITVCVVLLMLSGLFSGLNLGLMSLDQTELKIIGKVGSDKEKAWAKRIGPLRKRGNLLLCTLLLGNVMVNSTFTILFDNMTNGLTAVISSTIGIVVFGEIMPQAICSRHGLAVGANTYWLTVFFMILTFPASFPISLILDKILGEEMGQVYNKEKLQELIRMTADRRVLHDNEANIISGALQLTNKSVEDIMTRVEDVYMLEGNRILDFDTMTEIIHHGYTRVPVYDGEKTNIVNLLNTKDLALIDPDDKTPLSTVCKFYDHKPLYVDHDVKLDAMLQEFLQGDSHMAIVQKLHNNEDHDPYYETMGVVTLEDVIEEILQREIIDEKDMITDNRQKAPRPRKRQDYEILGADSLRSKLPKQLAFVAFQFLTTTVEPFSDAYLARNVLMNLMKKDIVVNLTPTEPVSSKNYLYNKGEVTDKFVLILQGTAEVITGEENMVFEAGPFSYFGKEALNLIRKQSILNETKVKDYVPDFSLRALTDLQYLCVNRALYLAALRTTRMLRNSGNIPVNEAFDAEFEKVTKLNSNRNSGFESHFVLGNTALELLKNDHQGAKKRSTSSLDRLTFLHHSLGALYHHSSQNAKDNSVEYHGEVGPEGKPLFPNVRASKSSGDGDSKSRHTPESKKKTLFSSLPFSSSSNKMYFHREAGESEPELKKKDLSIAVPTGADRKPPVGDHAPQDGLSSVVIVSDKNDLQTNSSFSESESKPLIDKPVPDTGKGASSSPATYNKGQDAEMVPLMNQTESTFDISVNSASV